VSVHKVPFTVLRLSENYSFTMSKLRIFGLRKSCNWHFLNKHTYCKNFLRVYRHTLFKRRVGLSAFLSGGWREAKMGDVHSLAQWPEILAFAGG